MRFSEYRGLIERLAAAKDTTGIEKTESRINFTKLNRQRMVRLEKTVFVNDDVKQALASNRRPMYWLVITESWCGDAAQSIPVIERIAAESDIIETRYILRDENLELMDSFLENGSRAIPRLVAIDARSLEVIGSWGSRPSGLKEYVLQLKERCIEKSEIGELLQRWYNDDKGRSLQKEFSELVKAWGVKQNAAAVA